VFRLPPGLARIEVLLPMFAVFTAGKVKPI
jgi:hypothetical protein